MVQTENATQRVWNDVLDFLARELHLSKADIHHDDEFSELGVDAILARSIAPSLSKLLGVNIPDAVFQNCPSVDAFRRYLTEQLLACQAKQPAPTAKKLPPKPMDVVISATEKKPKSKKKTNTTAPAVRPPATQPRKTTGIPLSMVLQGNPTTATETIFLLPDGSGSGMAYAGIPRVSPTTCVIGLNSPFLGHADDYHCSIEETAARWVPEIRARQPHGPYILGGWSAGGYYSFEVAKQLMAQGEAVAKLILLDSPCRTDFEALPMEVVRYLSASGRMGDWGAGPDRTPDWVTAHFEGTLRGVRRYTPTPMRVPPGLPVPQVFIIWCREGVWTTHSDGDDDGRGSGLDLSVKVTRFLLEGKPDFGTHGWEKLFPGADIFVATMPGNHFTLINQPYVRSLAPLLRDVAVAKGAEERKEEWQRF